MKDPIEFGQSILEFVEELPGPAPKHPPQTKDKPSAFIPRNAVSRPRAGLGSSKRATQTPVLTSVSSSGQESSELKSGKSQDDFRKLLG